MKHPKRRKRIGFVNKLQNKKRKKERKKNSYETFSTIVRGERFSDAKSQQFNAGKEEDFQRKPSLLDTNV